MEKRGWVSKDAKYLYAVGLIYLLVCFVVSRI